MSEQLGHWQTGLTIPEDFYGFIYKITNLSNNKSYIGKKQAKCIRKLSPLKGKKNKRKKIVETDWKTYTSSSPELNKDIELIGKQNFIFTIIKFCSCKWELAYFEAELQFREEVLFNPETYYNGIINLRINRAPKETLINYEITRNKELKSN